MLLAFSKPINIYLNRGLVIVRTWGGGSTVFTHALDTSIPEMLESVLRLNRTRHRWQLRDRYRFFLGASLCPAFDYSVPNGIKRWGERAVFAQQAAADLLGNDAFVCGIDASVPEIAAAMHSDIFESIRSWVRENGGGLQSAVPLWAAATQIASARPTGISALIINEPHACTAVLSHKDRSAQAFSLSLDEQLDDAGLEAVIRRWMVGAALKEQAVLRLTFNPEPHDGLADIPGVWQSHWQIT